MKEKMPEEILNNSEELNAIEKDNNQKLFMEDALHYTIQTVYGKIDAHFDKGIVSMLAGITDYSIEKAKQVARDAGKDSIYISDVKAVIDEVASYHNDVINSLAVQDKFSRNPKTIADLAFDEETRQLLDEVEFGVVDKNAQDAKVAYAFGMAKRELGDNASKDNISKRSMEILTQIKEVNGEYFTSKGKK